VTETSPACSRRTNKAAFAISTALIVAILGGAIRSAHAQSESRFRLVRVDGNPLPAGGDSFPNGCVTRMASATFTIAASRWAYTDSMTLTRQRCEEVRLVQKTVRHWAGTVTHKGDTLVFHTVSANGNPFVFTRGLIRRDSLFTNGDLFDGPAEIWVRP
jgi:hypothetical protein